MLRITHSIGGRLDAQAFILSNSSTFVSSVTTSLPVLAWASPRSLICAQIAWPRVGVQLGDGQTEPNEVNSISALSDAKGK